MGAYLLQYMYGDSETLNLAIDIDDIPDGLWIAAFSFGVTCERSCHGHT